MITDEDGNGQTFVTVTQSESDAMQYVDIAIEGYGTCYETPGHGTTIDLAMHEGDPLIQVWADINTDEPTQTISLAGACEDRREKR